MAKPPEKDEVQALSKFNSLRLWKRLSHVGEWNIVCIYFVHIIHIKYMYNESYARMQCVINTIFHSPTWLSPFQSLRELNLLRAWTSSFAIRQGFRHLPRVSPFAKGFAIRQGFRHSPRVSPFVLVSPVSCFAGFRFRVSPFAKNSFA
jgi:hypothetical protein